MGLITLVVCIIFLIYSLKTNNETLFSPYVIFYSLWTFILLLSNIKLYNMKEASTFSYTLLLLMLIFFFVGSNFKNLISKFNFKNKEIFKKNNKLLKKKPNTTVHYKIHYKIIYILIFMSLLFYIFDIFSIIKNLRNGVEMWQIRNWLLEPFESSNPILDRRTFFETLVRTTILEPIELLIPAIASYMFFYEKKSFNKNLFIILSLILLFVSSFAGGGGRLAFIYYAGCFLLGFYSRKKNIDKTDKKYKKYKLCLIIGCIIGILIICLYTIVRVGPNQIIRQVYTYFSLPVTLLSEWLEKFEKIEYTYGMTSFFGIHSYFFRFIDMIGLNQLVPNIYNISYQNILNAEIFLDVGAGNFNAFVTPVYYFFLDGGIFATCIYSVLFGVLVSKVYQSILNNINIKSFCIYIVVIYGILVSFMRIQTAIPTYIISFIIIQLIFKNRKNKSNE